MDGRLWTIVDDETFETLCSLYGRSCGLGIALIAEGGPVKQHRVEYRWTDSGLLHIPLFRMVEEAVRWGEPHIVMDRQGSFLWCVPVFCNNVALGGLFSVYPAAHAEDAALRIRSAAWELLEIAERLNLCNRGLMRLNRMTAQSNARTAEAIQLSKRIHYQNPRDLYLIEERRLLNAVRNGDVETARRLVNRILVGVYQRGAGDFDTLKSLVLEMVLQMYRSAVDEGADPRELSGANSAILIELLKIDNEYDLNRRLSQWLETFVNARLSENRPELPHSVAPAILYIKGNLDKPLTRDQVAAVCNLSPSYFSRLFKAATGYTFTTLLRRMRIERACELMDRTAGSVSEIAYSTGFSDQSYFTKIFKELVGLTPRRYRARSTTGYGGHERQGGGAGRMYKTIDS